VYRLCIFVDANDVGGVIGEDGGKFGWGARRRCAKGLGIYMLGRVLRVWR